MIGDETFALPYSDWSNRPKLPDFFFVNKPGDELHPLFHANRDVTAKDSIEDDPDTRNATSPDPGCRRSAYAVPYMALMKTGDRPPLTWANGGLSPVFRSHTGS